FSAQRQARTSRLQLPRLGFYFGLDLGLQLSFWSHHHLRPTKPTPALLPSHHLLLIFLLPCTPRYDTLRPILLSLPYTHSLIITARATHSHDDYDPSFQQQEPGLAHPLTQHFLRHNPPANRQEPSPSEKTSAGNCTALSPQGQ
ncbi:hypothetical protein CGCVW01_v001469, partial [Colletotrichum viniferum]